MLSIAACRPNQTGNQVKVIEAVRPVVAAAVAGQIAETRVEGEAFCGADLSAPTRIRQFRSRSWSCHRCVSN